MAQYRAINSAKALQARTGWPRPLCRRFVKSVDRQYRWRDAFKWWTISLAAYLACVAPVVAALIAMDRPPRIWLFVAPQLTGAAVSAAILGAYLTQRRTRLYRVLARFRAEPWCLKCHYPIPTLDQPTPVCPECGEPVPPQIARLARDRPVPLPH